eukprot:7076157-Prymnesium_polylepis.2
MTPPTDANTPRSIIVHDHAAPAPLGRRELARRRRSHQLTVLYGHSGAAVPGQGGFCARGASGCARLALGRSGVHKRARARLRPSALGSGDAIVYPSATGPAG